MMTKASSKNVYKRSCHFKRNYHSFVSANFM